MDYTYIQKFRSNNTHFSKCVDIFVFHLFISLDFKIKLWKRLLICLRNKSTSIQHLVDGIIHIRENYYLIQSDFL